MHNSICEVVGPNNDVLTNLVDIKAEAVQFFEEFLTQQPEDLEVLSVDRLQDILSFRCSDYDREKLVREVTDEEIKNFYFLCRVISHMGRMVIQASCLRILGQL